MAFTKRLISLMLAVMLSAGCAFASAEPAETNTDNNTVSEEETAEVDDAFPADEAPVSDSDLIPADDGAAASEEPEEAEESLPWQTPGNTDSEILNGGLFLYTDDSFYFSDGGIWYRSDSGERLVCSGDAKNLNLLGDLLYFTSGGTVYCVPTSGGTAEFVTGFDTEIDEMYVIGQELRFLAAGCVYSYNMNTDTLCRLDAPADIVGLIPTEYGNLFLTGSAFHYMLWAGTTCAMTDIERCYTDSGMLVIISGGQTLQAAPAALFSGDFAADSYSLHRDMAGGSGLSDEQEAGFQRDYFTSAEYQSLQDDTAVYADGVYISQNSNIYRTAQTSGTLTAGQQNLITRARLMAELTWTAAADLDWWTGTTSGTTIYAADGTVSQGVFSAGLTYLGVPYSQPVSNKGYIGWDISPSTFLTAAANAGSLLYTVTSGYYAGNCGPYYGLDCSGFVSYAWDLSSRRTVSHLRDSDVATYISPSLQNLQVGDTLNRDGRHVLLVTDLAYNANGSIISVEVTEQVPPKVKVTCYGELIPGRSYENTAPLSTLAAYLTYYSYSIYRPVSTVGITAPDTSAVDLDAAVRDVTATGWTKYHDSWYYFNENGEMVTGSWLDYNGKRYYLGYDGKMYASQWYGGYYLQSNGAMATGWCQIDGSWYYFRSDGTMVSSAWLDYNGSRYLLRSDGKMAQGTSSQAFLCQVDGSIYAFDTSGKMLTDQWAASDGSWYYLGSDGKAYTVRWMKSAAGNWYYFSADGKMVHGSDSLPLICKLGNAYYAFDANGKMLAGQWTKRNNTWYYFGTNGKRLESQWLYYNSNWYYFDSNGKMLQLSGITGSNLVAVYEIGGYYFGFSASGAMATGWGQTTDSWYYFGSNGRAYTSCWLKTAAGNWYYFDAAGKMLRSQWIEYKDYYYYLDAAGRMLTNTVTPDGYTVDASGHRTASY